MIPRFPLDYRMDPRLELVSYEGPNVLNVGAGINPIHGAVNADSVQKPGIDVVMDVTQAWPFPDGIFDKVLAFHIIEHIEAEQALHFFREAYRVLRPAALLIVECPDIVGLARELLDGNYAALRYIYSHNRAPGDMHRWGYDASSLAALATACGFQRTLTKRGTDYHAVQMSTVRLEAVRDA